MLCDVIWSGIVACGVAWHGVVCLHTRSFTANETKLCDMQGRQARVGGVNHKAPFTHDQSNIPLAAVRSPIPSGCRPCLKGQQRHGQRVSRRLRPRRPHAKQDGGQVGGLFWESVCAVSVIASCASTASYLYHIPTHPHTILLSLCIAVPAHAHVCAKHITKKCLACVILDLVCSHQARTAARPRTR